MNAVANFRSHLSVANICSPKVGIAKGKGKGKALAVGKGIGIGIGIAIGIAIDTGMVVS